MKRLAANQTIATLGLLAYVWVGLGVGSQLVYCVGSDGHSGIERAHGSAHDPVPGEANVAPGSRSCTDVPLVIQATKEQEKPSDRNPTTCTALSTISSHAVRQSRRPAPHHDVAFELESARSLRSTVLRI